MHVRLLELPQQRRSRMSFLRRRGLFTEIERDLLAEKPVATLLRKLLLLGGQTGSRELREWASKELRGYESQDELPVYRRVPAPIQMDGVSRYAQVWAQRIGVSELPDFARDEVGEWVELSQGVGEIEALARHSSEKDRSIKLSLPGARELARFMQSEAGGGIHIDALYWRVSKVALEGVVDQIRTRLTELMAELRALTPATQDLPNASQAEAAYNIVVRGLNARVVVNSIHGGHGSTNSIGTTPPAVPESKFWTRGRRIGAALVGFATILGTVIAILQVL